MFADHHQLSVKKLNFCIDYRYSAGYTQSETAQRKGKYYFETLKL